MKKRYVVKKKKEGCRRQDGKKRSEEEVEKWVVEIGEEKEEEGEGNEMRREMGIMEEERK